MLPNEKLRSQLSASIGSILSFACWTIVPFSYEIAPLMLPFAISNGISAGVGYAIIDVSTGGPKNSSILKNPILTGGGIGAFTGLVAPNYLYGEAYNVLYGIDSVTPLIGQVMAVPFVSQISCTTGFVAGCAMYPLLHYPIFGIKNVAWTGFSGVLLVLSAATVYTIYKTDVNKHDMIAPVGSFCKPDMVPLLNTIVRYNTQTKQFESYSVTTKEWVGDPIVCDKGSDMADSIRSYQKNSDSWGQTYTFDNPMLSYLCHYFDRAIAERFPENIVSLKDKQVLSDYEEMMYKTDLVVALVNEKNEEKPMQEIVDEKIVQMMSAQKSTYRSKCQRLLKKAASVAVGVELILAMQKQGVNELYCDHLKSIVTLKDVESWVRRRVPELMLFPEDEDCGFEGESVKSQLHHLEWESKSVDHALENWANLSSKERRTRWKVGIVATIGVFASLLPHFI